MNTIRDRLFEKAVRKKSPIMAAFELLPVCNLSCKMCYVRKSMAEVQAAGGLLNGKQWLAIAAGARERGLLFPLLTGGEPFLHPDFREIMAGMLDMGLQVSINSNGTMIDRETAAWLGKHPPVRINITLYGASPETYQNLCGSASAFSRVQNAVELLKEYHVPVKFNASITPQNMGDLEAILAYAKEVGSPVQVATYMFPPIRRDASLIGQNERLSPEEAGLARVRVDFLQNEPDWFLRQAERFRHFVDPETAQPIPVEPPEMRIHCRAGACSFWVDWQGNLSNCGMYGSAQTSLQGRPFGEAWRELVEKTEQVRYTPACTTCPNRRLCHPCIAMVYNECGDPNGRPTYLCEMHKAAARYYQDYAKCLPQMSPGAQSTAQDTEPDGCRL